MRRIIEYIRSLFCKHEYELISKSKTYENDLAQRPHTIISTYMCKKCGYVKKVKL